MMVSRVNVDNDWVGEVPGEGFTNVAGERVIKFFRRSNRVLLSGAGIVADGSSKTSSGDRMSSWGGSWGTTGGLTGFSSVATTRRKTTLEKIKTNICPTLFFE